MNVRILEEPLSRALVVENPHATLDTYLTDAGFTVTRLAEVPDEATLIAALQQTRAQVICKRSRVPITRGVLEACPDLHVVQLCCIGDDSVDKEAAADHGVLVFNDPVSNGRSVVELAVGHLIALSRRLYETDVATHANRWQKTSVGRFEVLGKRLGIVGLGNIGRQTARACEALGMEIRFYDNRMVAREVGDEMGWSSCDDLGELFRTCDMVTVHTSAFDAWGKSNEGLLDPYLGLLAADRPEGSPKIFLNLARGNVHSPEALLAAVKEGAIRRAAVDVYPIEPAPGEPGWSNPYADEPRVTCTPHIGAATQEAQPRIARRVSSTLINHARYGALRDCVYQPKARIHFGDQARGHAVLAVVHSTSRGTKKAVADAIYEAEADTIGSTHRDFEAGIAFDLSVLDRPLTHDQLQLLATRAAEIARDPHAIRAIRQVVVPKEGF